jgi:hypothetical protein
MVTKKSAKKKRAKTSPEFNIKEYEVMFGTGRDNDEARKLLVEEVNRMIALGWQPLGGISTLHFPSSLPAPIARNHYFAQAIVRYQVKR